MNARIVRSVVAAVMLLSGIAFAQEQAPATAAGSEELVEKVVVRNRLFTTNKRFELGVNVGFSMMSRMVESYNFNASAAYNLLEVLALELRVGYALSQHTSLANTVATDFYANSRQVADDLSDMWQLGPNAVLGLRFQPIYGKIGLLAEYPIHFQFYLWAGGGAALMHRESVMICVNRGSGSCNEYFTQDAVAPLVSAAIGLRLALPTVLHNHTIKLEVRDYSFLDNYYTRVNRMQAAGGNPPGNGNGILTQAGVTNQVFIDIGYAYVF